MSIFKRVEVWILLVLAVAGLVYVLLSQQESPPGRAPGQQATRPDSAGSIDSSPDAKAPTTEPQTPAFDSGGQLEVTRVRVNRNGREYLTEVDFSYDNQTQETLRTIEDGKLITASGKALPVFFVAFTGAPPELPAAQKSDATVRFQLGSEDIIGELSLDVGGQRTPVKSARSFDPEAIASRESKSFNSTEW
ncbi:MAG: hypothetical protein ACR2RV_28275 [Verrucomicrobiales bacterium]